LPAIIPLESGYANLSRNSAILVAIGDWSLPSSLTVGVRLWPFATVGKRAETEPEETFAVATISVR
jgi:hypothetical protein